MITATEHSESLRLTRLEKIQNSRKERDPNPQPDDTEGHLQRTSDSALGDTIARYGNRQGAATMFREAEIAAAAAHLGEGELVVRDDSLAGRGACRLRGGRCGGR